MSELPTTVPASRICTGTGAVTVSHPDEMPALTFAVAVVIRIAAGTPASTDTLRRMVEGLTELSQPEVAADVTAFFAETPVPAATKAIAQSLERLRANVALRSREGDALGEFLSGK